MIRSDSSALHVRALLMLFLAVLVIADSGRSQSFSDSTSLSPDSLYSSTPAFAYPAKDAAEGLDRVYSGQWVLRYDIEIIDSFALVLTEQGLQVTDLPTAESATVLNIAEIPERTSRMASEDGLLYVATHDRLLLYDVSSLPSLTQVGQYEHSWAPQDVKVADGFAYVLRDTCIEVFDCRDHSDILHLEEISLGDTYERGIRLRISGSTLFAGSRHLHAYDIGDPFNIVPIYQIEARFFIYDVVQVDSTVIVADVSPLSRPEAMEIRTYNIADTANIVQTSKQIFPFIGVSAMAMRNDTLFMTHRDRGVSLWDIANPAEPELFSCFLLDGLTGEIYARPDYFIVNCDLVSPLQDKPRFTICSPLDSTWLHPCGDKTPPPARKYMGGVFRIESGIGEMCISGQFDPVIRAHNILIQDDTLYTIDYDHGLTIIDPSSGIGRQPVSSTTLEPDYWLRPFDVYGDVAYVAADMHGLKIVDIRDRNHPVLYNTWPNKNGVVDVSCWGDVAAVATEYRGIYLLDISDRLHPTQIGEPIPMSYRSLVMLDNIVYAASDYARTTIIDVADPTAPVILDSLPDAARGVTAQGNLLVTHDLQTIRVYDRSVPAAPVLQSEYQTAGFIRHLQLNDGVLVASLGDYGFELISLSDPSSPRFMAACASGYTAYDAVYSDNHVWVAEGSSVSGYYYDPLTGVLNPDADNMPLPSEFTLSQNYPNPFNPTTTIEYDLPKKAHVNIEVFNILGQQVRSLVDTDQPAGSYRIEWDGVNDAGVSVATGVYFYRLTAGDQTRSQKMVLVR